MTFNKYANRALVQAAEQRIAELHELIDDVAGRAPLQAMPLSPGEVESRRRSRTT